MALLISENGVQLNAVAGLSFGQYARLYVCEMFLPTLLFILGFKLLPILRKRLQRSSVSTEKSKLQVAEDVSDTACDTPMDWEEEYVCDWSPESFECEQQVSADASGGLRSFESGVWSDFGENPTRSPSDDCGQSMRGDDEDWSGDDADLCVASNLFNGPEAIMEADVGSALEAALVSGDSVLAESILTTGARLCGAAWLSKACGKLRLAGVRLRSVKAVEFAKTFGRESRPDLAVDLWLEVCMDQGRDPSAVDGCGSPPEGDIYGAVLEACVDANDFEAATRAARATNWRAPAATNPAGQQALLSLSRWLSRRRVIGPAMACYDSVRRSGGAVDLPTHRAVLKACVSGNDMMRAAMLFHDLLESGGQPDFAMFSAMIHGYRAAGSPEEAISYFELMKRHGIQPDASLFETMLDSCIWQDVPAIVEQVISDMEAAGVTPSSNTLATVLKLYGRSCNIVQSLDALEELPRRHGLQVDGRAYSTMVSTCLKGGRLDLALETFDRMTLAGCRPKQKVYEVLLSACMRRGDLERAVRLVDNALGLSPVQLAVADEHAEEHAAEQQADVEERPTADLGAASSAPALAGEAVATATPRVRLEQSSIDSLLKLLGRRQESARLGLPLLARLRQALAEVPESIAAALESDARRGLATGRMAELAQRHETFQNWRDFRLQPCN